MSDQHLQIMHEHYCTDDGTWHTRELYPWEYDLQIQACIEASRLQSKYEQTIFLEQAKIFQDRANYLRQAKKKRNQKTRQQYKKKAQRVTIQEAEHLDIQSSGDTAAKCTRFGAAFSAGKHVVLQRVQSGAWDMATSSQHAVISCVGMALFDGMIMALNGAIWMARMGVG